LVNSFSISLYSIVKLTAKTHSSYIQAMTRPKSDIKRVQSGLRLRPEIIKALRHLAIDLEQPLNVVIEAAAEDYLQKHNRSVSLPPASE
jgi:hypothetical protein